MGIEWFIQAMRAWKENEWVDIKELNPLGLMPYIARLFHKVTGVSLSGHEMGGNQWLLPLEDIRAGPAPCLPPSPWATHARRTHEPTKQTAPTDAYTD